MLHLRTPTPVAICHAGSDMTACPRCASDLLRIRRRPVDRVAGWFAPSRRYRCQSFRCQWEGNLRNQRGDFADSTQYAGLSGTDTESGPAERVVPRTFIVSMVLSVLGTVFVVVAASTDWIFPVEPEQWFSSEDSWRAQPALVAKSPAATTPAAK